MASEMPLSLGQFEELSDAPATDLTFNLFTFLATGLTEKHICPQNLGCYATPRGFGDGDTQVIFYTYWSRNPTLTISNSWFVRS